jgi:hypothetical protein
VTEHSADSRSTFTHAWSVRVGGIEVGAFWPARGGGYTLRTGGSLVRARVHHFSAAEGLEGLAAYVTKRYGAPPELLPPENP